MVPQLPYGPRGRREEGGTDSYRVLKTVTTQKKWVIDSCDSYLHGQFNWIRKYEGDIPLRLSMKAFPENFNREGKICLEYGRFHPTG